MTDAKINLNSDLTVNKLKINNVSNVNQFVLTGSDGNILNNSSLSIFNNDLKLNPVNNVVLNSDMVLQNKTLYYDIDKSTYVDVNNVITTNITPTPILILNTSPNTSYIISFEISGNNNINNTYSLFTAYVNVNQGLINTVPVNSDFINLIITSFPEMENTNVDVVKENNLFKLVVVGLPNTQIYWKSSVKISSNSGNSNIVNNGSGYVKLDTTDTVSVNENFKINFSNTTLSNLILNSINQNVIKKSLMYNNDTTKCLTELYDPTNNKGSVLLNNTNVLDYTLTSIKCYKQLDLNNNKITNLLTPTSDTDATTKLYVDNKMSLKYGLITQNTIITQAITTTLASINTTNGSLLTNNFVNTTYTIDTTNGTIKINEVGVYDISVSFDYLVDVYNILTLSFGLNDTTILRKITNNESNKYRTVQFNTIINVSSSPYNASLYIKITENITTNMTIENLTFKILKLG